MLRVITRIDLQGLFCGGGCFSWYFSIFGNKNRALICKDIQKDKHQEEIKPYSTAEFSAVTNIHTKLYLLDMAAVMQILPSTFHIEKSAH